MLDLHNKCICCTTLPVSANVEEILIEKEQFTLVDYIFILIGEFNININSNSKRTK